MPVSEEVLIVGAGPYGLSVAAHLRARGVGYRIFGTPMLNWRDRMPKGMLLKSDAFASNLSDPQRSLTLKQFATRQGLPYRDEGLPVPLDTFIAYGEAFQRRFVPEVEERRVVALERDGDGFAARLDNGEMALGRRAVVAIGISDFPYVPPELADAPAEYLSHPTQYGDMAVFSGRSLAVIGTGSSAIDLAGLAHESGAEVQIVTRRPQLKFHGRTELKRSWRETLNAPNTGIGPGWRNVFYSRTPHLFRYLPDDTRQRIVNRSHGPAGGWYMRERVAGIPIVANSTPEGYEIRDGRIHLRLLGADGSRRTVSADHVIAATGYRVDLRRVAFLADALRAEIGEINQTPVLSPYFETTARGLYIIGPASAYSFSPLMRFVVGAEFTAPRLAAHLAATAQRRAVAHISEPVPSDAAKEAA